MSRATAIMKTNVKSSMITAVEKGPVSKFGERVAVVVSPLSAL